MGEKPSRDRDEPVKIDLPPDEALRGLLAVDPESEPDEDDEDDDESETPR